MTTETAVTRVEQPQLTPFEVIEKVITQGDLAKMSAAERVAFYWRTCESLGLNPLTRPFEFITLNSKLTMYARKDATDQLRKLNAVSVTDVRREKDDELGLLIVYARGRDKTGREDEATGVVSIKGLAGEALANASMKAETKAKRRLTLSLVGLGFLDESEVEGSAVSVDAMTGEIIEPTQPKSLIESVRAQQAAMAADEAASQPTAAQELGDAAEGTPAAATPREAVSDGLTREQLVAELERAGVSIPFAQERAKAMFADAGGQLSDAQRGELLADLTSDALAAAGL